MIEPRLILAYGLTAALVVAATAVVLYVRRNSWSRRYERRMEAERVAELS